MRDKLMKIIQESNLNKFERICSCRDRLCEICVCGREERDDWIPITLADVLIALEKKKLGDGFGWSIIRDKYGFYNEKGEWLEKGWDLKKDLQGQNDEILTYLYDVLKMKNL